MPKCSLKLALLRYLSTSMRRPKMGDLEKQTLQKPLILGPAPPAVTRIPVNSATSAARQSLSPNLQLHHGPARSVDRRITASSATNAARQSLLSQLIGIVRSAARIMTVSSAAIAVHPVHSGHGQELHEETIEMAAFPAGHSLADHASVQVPIPANHGR